MKRFADLIISTILIIMLSPLFIIICIFIIVAEGFPIFFKQERVGKNWKIFKIYKFRSMVNGAEKKGLGVSTENDIRITTAGKYLRKFKLDELPQFFNVFKGDMSIVGPRPELLKYAEIYKKQYNEILRVRPGITDYASIKYRDEGKLLEDEIDKEKAYISKILPEKIVLNLEYINEIKLIKDLKIIIYTIKAIF